MFEHSDRNEGIVLAADIAVIVEYVLDLPGQPLGFGATMSVRDLLLGNVIGPDFHAVMFGHEQRETAPAATCFDHAVPRFQA